MKNYRVYGNKPYNIILLHGGPGAPGSLSSLGKMLSVKYGLIEHLQESDSIDGQIKEIKEICDIHDKEPFIIIGHSWGAWLGYLFAAKYPECVKKLILVGAGPFESKYINEMNDIRENRFTDQDREIISKQWEVLKSGNSEAEKKKAFGIMGKVISKIEIYRVLDDIKEEEITDYKPEAFFKLMDEVNAMRKSGELLNKGKDIKCHVTAIHGDYDPHPFKGVEETLTNVVDDFKMIIIEKCGHYPWKEVHGRKQFLELLCDLL
ncbi:alpha/beta fold hydrolase [Oceanirhabdus seepicola]|uniref:Alpha/beta hydrolase n=1 Tax=Oceanirhabdus seepicola TaxID=2828781 RepID=A0A9J6NZC7_9CLOT|nr:alpha/beta hydrolase [Oceanirhabdus seepicola]MCM1989334.1 alpha/beta hydrolase [Oceanirhabdus seepicola]